MPNVLVLFTVLAGLSFCSAAHGQETGGKVPDSAQLSSPNGNLQAAVRLGAKGEPRFEIAYHGRSIASGSLGLALADGSRLQEGFRIVATRRASCDETYGVPVGKASSARDHHHELIVSLEEITALHRKLELVFRAFDDGVAFRYVISKQEPIGGFVTTEELTKLSFPGDPTAHFLPLGGYTTSYEAYYETKPVSAIEPDTLIALPMLLERAGDGESPVWTAITEANLVDYAGMYLSRVAGAADTFAAKLSPLPNRTDGAKVLGRAPLATPWRVLMVANDPGRLVESQIVFNLSDPCAIADTSWIKPGKTTFPWWNGYVLDGVDFKPGLNTATYKHYIDFCAEQGIPYHTIDGTDTAWYGGPIVPDGPTDVTKAVPEIDLPELLRYAKEKGVRLRLWMHWRALAPQIDEAFPLYEKWGVEGVMVDFMDRDDQEMVKFYHDVAEKAARRKLTVVWHGAYKPTGMERTWPNVLTYEGALNQEYNKWEPKGTPPEHGMNVALVRMLAGPVDYHQGGMRNVLPADFQPRYQRPLVPGTRGYQLATYIVFQNHLSMMADDPAAYRGQPDLPFLVHISTTWDETRVLRAEFGKCVAIARRSGRDWYVGAMTASKPQNLDLPLTFLGPGQFHAEVWSDDLAAGPTAVVQSEQTVSANDTLRIKIPANGGAAMRLTSRASSD